MKQLTAIPFLASLLVLGACSKDDPEKDLEKPVMEFVTEASDSLRGGDWLEFSIQVTDNEALSQMKINVHDNFDGHTHGKKGEAQPFTFDSIVQLSGTSQTVEFRKLLPEDLASGNYDILIHALDQSGNEADFLLAAVHLKNAFDAEPPQLTAITTQPAMQNGELHLASGETVQLSAQLSDNSALLEAELLLVRESDEEVVWDKDLDISGTFYALNESVTLDASWPAGDYGLVITVKDEKGNSVQEEIHIHYK